MASEASWVIDGGELGERIRSQDWSNHVLGPLEEWPPGLRMQVNLCLASPLPMLLAWGPQGIMLYNDSYRALLGTRHPALLGSELREALVDLQPVFLESFETALSGASVMLEDQRVFLPRHGALQETFFTCSFSPLRDEHGKVTGVLSVGTETSTKALGTRRSRLLRDVAAHLVSARTPEEVFTLTARALKEADRELPFLLFYLWDGVQGAPRLVASTGLVPGSVASPRLLEPGTRAADTWRFSQVLRGETSLRVEGLAEHLGPLGCGPYPESPSRALLLPLRPPGPDALQALLVAGVSPRLELDEAAQGFLEQLATEVSTALARVQARERPPRSVPAFARSLPGPRDGAPVESPPHGESFLGRSPRLSPRKMPGHIVVVDDDTERREALRHLLLEQGWGVHLVDAGSQALAVIRARVPDVVICELAMSGMDALTLLRELRSDPALRTVSLLFVSAEAEEAARGEGLTLEADDYLSRPVSAQELTARVQCQLALVRLRRTAEGYREQLHQLFKDSPAAIAILTGPQHVFEFVNARFEAFTHHPELVGKRFQQVFPELEAQGFLSLLGQVYRTGVPFLGQEMAASLDREGNGQLEPGYFNFSYHPYKTPDGQVQGVVVFVIDATEWVRSRQQAEQRAAELEAVIQSIPDGVCIADATGIIRSNRTERELLHITGIREACERALQGEATTREVPMPQGPGEPERIIRSATAPVRLRERIVGAVSLNVDITERKRAEAEREMLLASEQAARLEAEGANRRKDEFLARISHELATPLVAMRMWFELLQNDESKRTEALAALRQCTQTQSKIVHDLLDTARALNGKLTVSLEACEPGEPVQAAVNAILPVAERKGVALKVSLRQTPLVEADPGRLQQVVANLLGNAVKFTPEGGKVEVRLEPARDGVSIVVSDTGRGFPAGFQSLLFTPFRQEEEGTTRSNGGLGLGLAIVRQLVELHGGRVWAESPGQGQGATFTVWLPPLSEDAEDASREDLADTRGRQLEGVRLLLVEDDVLTRTAVLSVLEQQGAEVRAVGSAADALALVRTTRFDAMLCDIAMPGEDGYSLIRKVRALEPPASQLPAAAFTAHMREEDRAHALRAGFQLHIPKAVEPAQLIAQVRLLARDRSDEGVT